MLQYQGCSMFRYRVILSILSGKPMTISDIRAEDMNPGLRDFEASFLRLIDKITNGTQIEINETGTKLKFKPGLPVGGKINHECGVNRSIGYFLEPMILLAPFTKKGITIWMTGVTNDDKDPSVDIIRTVTLPVLKHFGVEEGVELKISKRGAPPLGGGEVMFKCPVIRELKAMQLVDETPIRRIRGIAYATRVSPQAANRLVDSARSVLNQFIPDIYIYTDHYKGGDSGKSPGFGLSIVGESTTGNLMSAECIAKGAELPEDLGAATAKRLLEELHAGGCVDSSTQHYMMTFMALCPEDVSKLRVGKLTEYSVNVLRLLRDFFGITFRLKPDDANNTIMISCLGVGYKNLARAVC